MTTRSDIPFPCDAVPEDPGIARLVGLYPQRQDGLWMQRVKVLGGALTGEEWCGLAKIARQFTPDVPLHLTTRQDVELHDIPDGGVGEVQHALAEAGLTSLGACGDTLRNLTVCPCSGTKADSPELRPLAWQIRRLLEGIGGVYSLPRKFKISLSCGDKCGQPWINDLGLVAELRNGQWGFRVIIAGSLGARPGTGVLLYDWLEAGKVLPLVVAAVRFFAAQGDREHRSRARLRHVRERIGDVAFAAALKAEHEQAQNEQDWADVQIPVPTDTFEFVRALTFANGDVTPEVAEALGTLAGRDDMLVRIANHHRIMVFARDEQALSDVLDAGHLSDVARPQATVVACPGTRWCSRAIVSTNTLADRIRSEFTSIIAPDVTVAVSGCPNGCAHSAVADIGLTGTKTTLAGKRVETFRLFVGGGMGHDNRLAEPVAERLTRDEVIQRMAVLVR